MNEFNVKTLKVKELIEILKEFPEDEFVFTGNGLPIEKNNIEYRDDIPFADIWTSGVVIW